MTRVAVVCVLAAGCSFAPPDLPPREPIDLAAPIPHSDAAVIPLGAAAPMYHELLAVDLRTVIDVATARNLEVQQAQQRVEAQRAQLQSVAGWLFPSLGPALVYEQVDGTVRATQGNLVDAGFHTLQPYVLAQWFMNPGKVVYEIVAARKRMVASQFDERATQLAVTKQAALEYYDLVLAQAKVDAARQNVTEARELRKIAQARVRAGAGLPGDEMRAKAELATLEQALLAALGTFHAASVTLAQTLDLDPTVTLAPSGSQVALTPLVRDDLAIDALLAIAIERRDDLEGVRTLAGAATAATAATRWAALGPQAGAGYQYGGIAGHAEGAAALGGNRAGFDEQRRLAAGVSFELTLASLGHLAAASIAEQQAALDAKAKLAAVQAQVVRADQDTKTMAAVSVHARDRLNAAEEALRLARANLEAGAMTVLDVLHDESRLAQARLGYAEVVVGYNQSQIELLAALGVLHADLLRR